MKTIELKRYGKGKSLYTLVDDKDFKELSKHCWYINSLGYVCTKINDKHVYIHRKILGATSMVVDHINRNKLDNRRSNLRLCTVKENVRNCKISKNNTSGFVGVSKHHTGKWRAYIMVDRKQINLGLFGDIKKANIARKNGEKKYFGKFAPL